jgi:hypothetical protein
MSKWFFIVLVIIFLTFVIAVLVRIEGRRKIKRLKNEDFSVDDFEIIE